MNYYLSTKIDKLNIIALMQQVYPAYSYNETFFDWQYTKNPYKKAKIFVAEKEGKIIGMYACVPHIILKNNKTYPIWRVQEVMIHADYRKQGIFEGLMAYAQNRIHWSYKDIFWAFPNEKSFSHFLKQGFFIHSKVIFWEYKTEDKTTNISLSYDIKEKQNFDFIQENRYLFLVKSENKYLNLLKEEKYLTWRYIQKNKEAYFIYTIYKNKELKGYMVIKKYINKENESSLHICELQAINDEIEIIESLLFFAITQKKKHNTEILNTFASSFNMEIALKNLFFVSKQTDKNIVFWAADSSKKEIASKIRFSLGDNDIF